MSERVCMDYGWLCISNFIRMVDAESLKIIIFTFHVIIIGKFSPHRWNPVLCSSNDDDWPSLMVIIDIQIHWASTISFMRPPSFWPFNMIIIIIGIYLPFVSNNSDWAIFVLVIHLNWNFPLLLFFYRFHTNTQIYASNEKNISSLYLYITFFRLLCAVPTRDI